MFLGNAKVPAHHKHFHIFHKNDVTKALLQDITLANSQARQASQTPEQKVVFESALVEKQIGEIEDRHDSPGYYREMKFRLNAGLVFRSLKGAIKSPNPKQVRDQATAYGRATRLFK